MKTALYWKPLDNKRVQCTLCPHNCIIAPGHTGICAVRENRDGTLITLNYLCVSSCGIDPIEKKPLYHFFPGSQILSVGTYGCNLSCKCCQNYTISKEFPRSRLGHPSSTVDEIIASLTSLSQRHQLSEFCGLAYTYSEPTVWAETILELGPLVQKMGLKNVFVTNGFISRHALDDFCAVADAFNIDLKGFDDSFYHSFCGAALEPVLDTIKIAARHAHVELTTLVIPSLNDSNEQLTALRDWIADEIGTDTPVHLSRYFPTYHATQPSTPVATLHRARDILAVKLRYVYIGNTGDEQNTECAHCGQIAISRSGYTVQSPGLNSDGACSGCGAAIAVCS